MMPIVCYTLNYCSNRQSKIVQLVIKLCFIGTFYSLCNLIGSRMLVFSSLCAVYGLIICGIKFCFYEDPTSVTKEFFVNFLFFHLILDFIWPKGGSSNHQMFGPSNEF